MLKQMWQQVAQWAMNTQLTELIIKSILATCFNWSNYNLFRYQQIS